MDQTQSRAPDLYLNVKGEEDENDRGMWNKHEEVTRNGSRGSCVRDVRCIFFVAWLVQYSARNQGGSK